MKICILGDVNHGKSTLFDTILGIESCNYEVKQITQKNKSITINKSILREKFPKIKKALDTREDITNISFIDVPGHRIFFKLKERSVITSDLCIIVFDATKDWSTECDNILKLIIKYKKPVILLLNKFEKIMKIDCKNSVKEEMNNISSKVYLIIDQLSTTFSENNLKLKHFEEGWKTEMDEVLVLPTSGKENWGINELLILCILKYTKTEVDKKIMVFEAIKIKDEKAYIVLSQKKIKDHEELTIGSSNYKIKKLFKFQLGKKNLEIIEVRELNNEFGIITFFESSNFLPGIFLEEGLLSSSVLKLDNSGIIVKGDSYSEVELLYNFIKEELKLKCLVANTDPLTEKEIHRYQIQRSVEDFSFAVSTNLKLLKNFKDFLIVEDHMPSLLNKIEDKIKEITEKKREVKRKLINLPCLATLEPNCLFKAEPIILGITINIGTLNLSDIILLDNLEFKINNIQVDKKTQSQLKENITGAVELIPLTINPKEIIFKDLIKKLKQNEILHLKKNVINEPEIYELLTLDEKVIIQKFKKFETI